MATHRARQGRTGRLGVAALATVALSGVGVVAATQSQAAGLNLLATTTSVSASDYTPLTAATPITITASVKAAPVGGLLVTPSGPVDFYVSGQGTDAEQYLGSANVKACLLTACTASITIHDSDLPVGYDRLLAGYEGDTLTKSSQGTVYIGSGVARGIDFSYDAQCVAEQPCHTGSVSSLDGSTAASIDAPPQPYDYTIQLGVGPEPLPCSTVGGGETADWNLFRDFGDGTASFTGTKTVTYLAFDSSATAGLAWTAPHVCFESDFDFVGSYPASPPFQNTPPTPGSYAHGMVPFDSGEQHYVGLLDTCASNGNVAPCIVSDASVPPAGGHSVEQRIVVSTVARDPRISN